MNNLQHKVWQAFKDCGLDNHQNFILAVSGGLDSCVLLDLICQARPQAKIVVAHYHHGLNEDIRQTKYRDEALELVKHKISSSNKSNITFVLEKSEKVLNTEEEMRNARWSFFEKLKVSDEVFVLGHHLDDRFETMLLKMIRGTSIDGFDSFKMYDGKIFRPLLNVAKEELVSYAEEHKLSWLEDPSNQHLSYIRNWLREGWLRDLDNKIPGARKNLAKSFFKIAEAIQNTDEFELVFEGKPEDLAVSRVWYLSLSKANCLRALALFLKKHQIYRFTAGQLEEIYKRLDKNQKEHTFDMLDRKWVINATQIMLR